MIVGIWVEEAGGSVGLAEFLETRVADDWQCPLGWKWQRSVSHPHQNDYAATRENYATCCYNDVVGFWLDAPVPPPPDETLEAVRGLLSVTVGGAVVRRVAEVGHPPPEYL